MSKASESDLGALHGEIARSLTRIVKGTHDGDLVIEAPAAYLAVAVGFLKNNNITADAGKNEELSALSEALRKRRTAAKGTLSDRMIDEAAQRIEGSLGGLMN